MMAKLILPLFISLVLVVALIVLRQENIARQNACNGNLFSIATAVNQYYDKYGHYPPSRLVAPDGKAMHSWRVLILEFLDPDLFRQYSFDEPWNSPRNRKLESRIPNAYRCPNSKSRQGVNTAYAAVTGPGFAFDDTKEVKREDLSLPIEETVLLIELLDLKIHWMDPADIGSASANDMLLRLEKGGLDSRDLAGPGVCMANGTFFRISTKQAFEKAFQALAKK